MGGAGLCTTATKKDARKKPYNFPERRKSD